MNSAVDGLTRPATIAAISLLITSTLPFWREDSVFRLNSIIVCFCVFWLFVSFLNYKQYLSSLIHNLRAGRILMGRSVPKLPASNSSVSDAKKEFGQKLSSALLTHDMIASLSEESRFHPLRQALENELVRCVEHMTSLLFAMDEKVNFHKLIRLVKFAKAGVKSEALEVFKGVLGPKRTDEFSSLFQLNKVSKKETFALKDLIRSLGEQNSHWILSALLLAFDPHDFSENEDFLRKCLSHSDELVRETALQVYLRHEADTKGVSETCRKFSDDSSTRISQLAQDRLALS
jgi:hypothetical protein